MKIPQSPFLVMLMFFNAQVHAAGGCPVDQAGEFLASATEICDAADPAYRVRPTDLGKGFSTEAHCIEQVEKKVKAWEKLTVSMTNVEDWLNKVMLPYDAGLVADLNQKRAEGLVANVPMRKEGGLGRAIDTALLQMHLAVGGDPASPFPYSWTTEQVIPSFDEFERCQLDSSDPRLGADLSAPEMFDDLKARYNTRIFSSSEQGKLYLIHHTRSGRFMVQTVDVGVDGKGLLDADGQGVAAAPRARSNCSG